MALDAGRRCTTAGAGRRKPLPAETAPLVDALGRVLTDDVAALRTQPPAAVSAMDGYAVRASDVAQAPVTLKVIGEVAAGHPFAGEVAPGQAARIFTGGVMPTGGDTVVIQELTTADGDRSRSRSQPPGAAMFARKASTSRGIRSCCAKDAG